MKIFIGDHSTIMINFTHVTHVIVENQRTSKEILYVYLIGVSKPIGLEGIWAKKFQQEYLEFGAAGEFSTK